MTHAAVFSQRQPFAIGLQLLLALGVGGAALQALRGGLMRLRHGAVAGNVFARVLIQRGGWCHCLRWLLVRLLGRLLRCGAARQRGQAQQQRGDFLLEYHFFQENQVLGQETHHTLRGDVRLVLFALDEEQEERTDGGKKQPLGAARMNGVT